MIFPKTKASSLFVGLNLMGLYHGLYLWSTITQNPCFSHKSQHSFLYLILYIHESSSSSFLYKQTMQQLNKHSIAVRRRTQRSRRIPNSQFRKPNHDTRNPKLSLLLFCRFTSLLLTLDSGAIDKYEDSVSVLSASSYPLSNDVNI